MKFKNVGMAAGLLLQLVSFHAHAESEGGKDPFQFQAPAQTSPESRYASDAGQERFPDLAGRAAQVPEPVRFLAMAGSESPLLSVASAPAGSDEGTVAFAQTQSLQRYDIAKRMRAHAVKVASAAR